MKANWKTIPGDTPQEKLAAVGQVLHLEDRPLEWERRKVVGVAWDSKGGEFSIVAARSAASPVFVLQRFSLIEGTYPTLATAQAAAEKLRRQVTVVVKKAR